MYYTIEYEIENVENITSSIEYHILNVKKNRHYTMVSRQYSIYGE